MHSKHNLILSCTAVLRLGVKIVEMMENKNVSEGSYWDSESESWTFGIWKQAHTEMRYVIERFIASQ